MNLFDQDFEDEEENQQTESVEDVSGIVGEVGSPPVETQTEFIPEITRTANDDDVADLGMAARRAYRAHLHRRTAPYRPPDASSGETSTRPSWKISHKIKAIL